MRFVLLLAVLPFAVLAGCAATGTKAPEAAKPAAAPAVAAAPVAVKAPQCWSGDQGKFLDVGTKTTISGVAVECLATTDGKNAQWMGVKK
jgi:hypothetical protein